MKTEDLEQFRAKLAAMGGEIRAISESAAQSLKPVALDQTSVGRVSRIDAMQLQQMSQEAARRRQHLLLKIEGHCAASNQADSACAFCAGRKSTFDAWALTRRLRGAAIASRVHNGLGIGSSQRQMAGFDPHQLPLSEGAPR